jgi:putative flippase GtrA
MQSDRSERARFVTFLVTGGIAALANVLARVIFERAMPFEAAVVLAYGVGMITAFVLARAFVFTEATSSMHVQAARFALVNAIAFAQVWIISVGLARLVLPAIGWSWRAETLAHLVGVASPVVTSYVLHRSFSFRSAPL